MVKLTFFLAPRIEPFSFQSVSQTFSHFKIVLFVDSTATGQKCMLNTFSVKEKYSRKFPSHLNEIAMLFSDWVKF